MEYIDLPHLNRYMLKGTVKCQIYKNIPYRKSTASLII